MNFTFNSFGKAYLYKLHNGEVVEYAGDVGVYERACNIMSNVTRGRADFRVLWKDGSVLKTFTCSNIEGVVYNGMVWLYEDNMKRAIQILLDHEQMIIDELELSMKMHEEKRDRLGKLYGYCE